MEDYKHTVAVLYYTTIAYSDSTFDPFTILAMTVILNQSNPATDLSEVLIIIITWTHLCKSTQFAYYLLVACIWNADSAI